MKLIKSVSVQTELSMGRPREDMTALVKALQETLQEHLWKVYAYHLVRPQNVNGWLKSLNKHLSKLRAFNVSKKGLGINMDRDQLLDKVLTELFEDRDIELLNYSWKEHGYPFVPLYNKDTEKLQTLATRYVDLILAKTGTLIVHPSELHD